MERMKGNNGNGDVKDIFTTGEAAEICRVSQQTIIRCIDSGRLEGFRVPGPRGFRRIPRQSLVRFMRENNIPMDRLESGKKKVLIVDDDEEIVEMLSDVLEREGYEIRTVSSGFEAGMATWQFRPDLILLDYMLPDVNAKEVCQVVRRDPELEDTRIIIMSGVVREDEIKQLLGLGAEGFIKKPFTPEELMNKIRAARGAGV